MTSPAVLSYLTDKLGPDYDTVLAVIDNIRDGSPIPEFTEEEINAAKENAQNNVTAGDYKRREASGHRILAEITGLLINADQEARGVDATDIQDTIKTALAAMQENKDSMENLSTMFGGASPFAALIGDEEEQQRRQNISRLASILAYGPLIYGEDLYQQARNI